MFNKPYFKITSIYILISSIWIFFSDKFLLITFKSSDFITKFQTFKGILFVVFTGSVLFVLIRKSYKKTMEQSREIKLLAESKDFFLKNVSHELKTPLNGIFLINALLKESSTLNKNELTLELEHCASELNELISNILEVSVLQNQNLDIYNSKINLSIFSRTLGMLYYLSARKKGVDFGIYLDPSLPLFITSDEKKLKKVIGNLIGNAVRFTSNGYILFEVLKKDNEDSILFKITDTGKGILNSSERDIFNSLFLNNSNFRKDNSGIGAGLIIAKQNAELLGGKIWFDSSLNKGSVFYFELPLKEFVSPILSSPISNNFEKNIIVISEYTANNIVLKNVLKEEECNVYFQDLSSNIANIYGSNYLFIVDEKTPITTLSSIRNFLSKDKSSEIVFIKEYFSKESEHNSLILPFFREDIINTLFNKKR